MPSRRTRPRSPPSRSSTRSVSPSRTATTRTRVAVASLPAGSAGAPGRAALIPPAARTAIAAVAMPMRAFTWRPGHRARGRQVPAAGRGPWLLLPPYRAGDPAAGAAALGNRVPAVLGHPAAGVVGDLGGDAGRLPGAGRGVVDDVPEQAHVLISAAELLAGGRMLRSRVTGSSSAGGSDVLAGRRALSTCWAASCATGLASATISPTTAMRGFSCATRPRRRDRRCRPDRGSRGPR